MYPTVSDVSLVRHRPASDDLATLVTTLPLSRYDPGGSPRVSADRPVWAANKVTSRVRQEGVVARVPRPNQSLAVRLASHFVQLVWEDATSVSTKRPIFPRLDPDVNINLCD
jgi:hypothetical protein